MTRMFRMFVCAGIAAFSLAACQKKEEPPPGPAEQLGRKLDQAATQGAVELNKMGENAGKALEKAGEAIQNKAKEAQQEADKK